jgi:hypothetical protein
VAPCWGPPAGPPQKPPRALWVSLTHEVFCGQDEYGNLWLAAKTEDAYDRYRVHGFLEGNYAFALRYDASSERLAEYESRLPDWVRPGVRSACLQAPGAVAAALKQLVRPKQQSGPELDAYFAAHREIADRVRADVWAKAPEPLVGRYTLRDCHTANDHDALCQAATKGFPLNKIDFEPGVTLLHTNGEDRFTGRPLAIWSDGTATARECKSESTEPLPKIASDLLSAAVRQRSWNEDGRWRRLLTVRNLVATQTLNERETRQIGSGAKAILERLTVAYADGHTEELLRLTETGWTMGEDGDVWTSVTLYTPDEAGQAMDAFKAVFEGLQ